MHNFARRHNSGTSNHPKDQSNNLLIILNQYIKFHGPRFYKFSNFFLSYISIVSFEKGHNSNKNLYYSTNVNTANQFTLGPGEGGGGGGE